MKIKTILFMVLSLMSFTVFAQNNGGVKGNPGRCNNQD